jgi:hypothetical protein
MKYRNICTSDAFNEAYSLEEANANLATRFYELTKDWDPYEVMQDFLEFVPDKVLQDYVDWLEETSLDESYNLKKSKD